MDPKEGDSVRFKHMRVETTGTVIERSGTHIRVQPKDGGATLWKELSELLPLASAVNEASEVAELQRLFSSGPSSARAKALSTRGVQAQAAAKQTISERPNKIGMPTPMPKPAVGPLQATPPEIKRPAQENAYLDDGDDTNLDGIDDAVAVAAQAAQVPEAEAEAEAEAKSAGELLEGMMRIRGGMGAGACFDRREPRRGHQGRLQRCIGAGAVGVPRQSGRTRKEKARESRSWHPGGSSIWADPGCFISVREPGARTAEPATVARSEGSEAS